MVANSARESGGAHAAFNDHCAAIQASEINEVFIESFETLTGSNVGESSDRKSFLGKLFTVPSYVFNFRVFIALLWRCMVIRPDIVHFHLFVGKLTVAAVLAASVCGARVFHAVHDYRAICARNSMLDSQGVICDLCTDTSFALLRKKCAGPSFLENLLLLFEHNFRRFVLKLAPIDSFVFVSQFARDVHQNSSLKILASDLVYNYIEDNNPAERDTGRITNVTFPK
ncbi:hypothetical protein N9334_00695 [Luminiphilus sp.]|nr:hypothetical protein [Luminiphilus sp.]